MERPGIEAPSLTAPKTSKEDRAQIKNSSEADRWIQAKLSDADFQRSIIHERLS